jgi:hypothetical protein
MHESITRSRSRGPSPWRRRAWLGAWLAAPSAACALDLATAEVPAAIPDRQVTAGPRTIHLPDGDWRELDHYVLEASAGARVSQADSAFIARIEHGTIGVAGRIVLLRSDMPVRSWRDQPCGGVEDIYVKDYSPTINFKDCVVVRSERVKDMSELLGRTFPKAVAWIAEQHMALPDTAIRIRYARYSTNTYGIVDLFVPTAYFDSEASAIAWSEGLRNNLRAVLEHRETDGTLPALPAPASP